MTNKKNYAIKTISLMLSFSMILSDFAMAGPVGSLDLGHSASSSTLLQDPSKFEAPLDFSSLKEIHHGKAKTFIIHMQDAHANLSGQQNLAGALDLLMSKYKVKLVLVEGGTKDDSLTSLKSLATPETWKRVAKKFLMEGKISGEEYLNLTSDHPMKIVGIEDKVLYMESLNAYAALAEKREETLSQLAKIHVGLEKLKRKLYPQELVRYEKLGAGSLELGASETNFEGRFKMLVGLSTNIDKSALPNVAKMIALQESEKSIDFDAANLEMAALAEKTAFAKSVGAKDSKLSQISFIERLLDQAKKKSVALQDYPELLKYRVYLGQFSEIDFDTLLDEYERLEDEVYKQILSHRPLSTIHDPLLVRCIDRYLSLLDSAYRIQMSTKEFEQFKLNEPDYATVPMLAFVNAKLAELGYFSDLIPDTSVFEEGKKSLETFYDSVSRRDMAFMRNTERILKEEGEEVAVLIAGGYHTAHLKKLFKEKEYSYAVLSPLVTSETNQAKYEKILLAPLKKETTTVTANLEEDLTSLKKKSDGIRPEATAENGARLAEVMRYAAPKGDETALAETALGLIRGARLSNVPGQDKLIVEWEQVDDKSDRKINRLIAESKQYLRHPIVRSDQRQGVYKVRAAGLTAAVSIRTESTEAFGPRDYALFRRWLRLAERDVKRVVDAKQREALKDKIVVIRAELSLRRALSHNSGARLSIEYSFDEIQDLRSLIKEKTPNEKQKLWDRMHEKMDPVFARMAEEALSFLPKGLGNADGETRERLFKRISATFVHASENAMDAYLQKRESDPSYRLPLTLRFAVASRDENIVFSLMSNGTQPDPGDAENTKQKRSKGLERLGGLGQSAGIMSRYAWELGGDWELKGRTDDEGAVFELTVSQKGLQRFIRSNGLVIKEMPFGARLAQKLLSEDVRGAVLSEDVKNGRVFDALRLREFLIGEEKNALAQEVNAVYRRAFQLASKETTDFDYVVIDLDGAVSGFILEEHWTPSHTLSRLASVRPGAGSYLMDAYFQELIRKNVKVVKWFASASAIGFYHRFLAPRVDYDQAKGVSSGSYFEVFLDTYYKLSAEQLSSQMKYLNAIEAREAEVRSIVRELTDEKGEYRLKVGNSVAYFLEEGAWWKSWVFDYHLPEEVREAKAKEGALGSLMYGVSATLEDLQGRALIGPAKFRLKERTAGARLANDRKETNEKEDGHLLREIDEEFGRLIGIATRWNQASFVVANFGSARIPKDHFFYKEEESFGALMWDEGMVPITGAGPSMMEAVLKGYTEKRASLGIQPSDANRAQGVLILGLSTEPANKYVESDVQMNHFMTRKFAFRGAKGAVIWPGGFGTMDELFEFWRRGIPIVFYGKEYWQPMLDAFEKSSEGAGVIRQLRQRGHYLVTNSKAEAIQYLKKEAARRMIYPVTGEQLALLRQETKRVVAKVLDQERSVVFVGNPRVGEELDEAVSSARALATRTTDQRIPVRIASRGPLFNAIVKAARKEGWLDRVEAVLFVPEGSALTKNERLLRDRFSDRFVTTSNESIHQLAMTVNAHAYIFLPGGIGTMNKLFDIATIIQTKKVRHKPILLMDGGHYDAFFESINRQMLPDQGEPEWRFGDRRLPKIALISPADVRLFESVRSSDDVIMALTPFLEKEGLWKVSSSGARLVVERGVRIEALESNLRARYGEVTAIRLRDLISLSSAKLLFSGAGRVLKLDLRDQRALSKGLYKDVRINSAIFAGAIATFFQEEFDVAGSNLENTVFELIKNAFVHGNQLDVELPIYIVIDPQDRRLRVFDLAIQKRASVAERKKAMEVPLWGSSMGLNQIRKYWDLEDSDVRIDGGAVLGHEYTARFRDIATRSGARLSGEASEPFLSRYGSDELLAQFRAYNSSDREAMVLFEGYGKARGYYLTGKNIRHDLMEEGVQAALFLLEWKADAKQVVAALFYPAFRSEMAAARGDAHDKLKSKFVTLVGDPALVDQMDRTKRIGSEEFTGPVLDPRTIPGDMNAITQLAKDYEGQCFVSAVKLAEFTLYAKRDYFEGKGKDAFSDDKTTELMTVYATMADRRGFGDISSTIKAKVYQLIYPREYFSIIGDKVRMLGLPDELEDLGDLIKRDANGQDLGWSNEELHDLSRRVDEQLEPKLLRLRDDIIAHAEKRGVRVEVQYRIKSNASLFEKIHPDLHVKRKYSAVDELPDLLGLFILTHRSNLSKVRDWLAPAWNVPSSQAIEFLDEDLKLGGEEIHMDYEAQLNTATSEPIRLEINIMTFARHHQYRYGGVKKEGTWDWILQHFAYTLNRVWELFSKQMVRPQFRATSSLTGDREKDFKVQYDTNSGRRFVQVYQLETSDEIGGKKKYHIGQRRRIELAADAAPMDLAITLGIAPDDIFKLREEGLSQTLSGKHYFWRTPVSALRSIEPDDQFLVVKDGTKQSSESWFDKNPRAASSQVRMISSALYLSDRNTLKSKKPAQVLNQQRIKASNTLKTEITVKVLRDRDGEMVEEVVSAEAGIFSEQLLSYAQALGFRSTDDLLRAIGEGLLPPNRFLAEFSEFVSAHGQVLPDMSLDGNGKNHGARLSDGQARLPEQLLISETREILKAFSSSVASNSPLPEWLIKRHFDSYRKRGAVELSDPRIYFFGETAPEGYELLAGNEHIFWRRDPARVWHAKNIEDVWREGRAKIAVLAEQEGLRPYRDLLLKAFDIAFIAHQIFPIKDDQRFRKHVQAPTIVHPTDVTVSFVNEFSKFLEESPDAGAVVAALWHDLKEDTKLGGLDKTELAGLLGGGEVATQAVRLMNTVTKIDGESDEAYLSRLINSVERTKDPERSRQALKDYYQVLLIKLADKLNSSRLDLDLIPDERLSRNLAHRIHLFLNSRHIFSKIFATFVFRSDYKPLQQATLYWQQQFLIVDHIQSARIKQKFSRIQQLPWRMFQAVVVQRASEDPDVWVSLGAPEGESRIRMIEVSGDAWRGLPSAEQQRLFSDFWPALRMSFPPVWQKDWLKSSDYTLELLNNPEEPLTAVIGVFEREGIRKIAGGYLYNRRMHTLNAIAVPPESRRRGVKHALVQDLRERYLWKDSVQKLELFSMPTRLGESLNANGYLEVDLEPPTASVFRSIEDVLLIGPTRTRPMSAAEEASEPQFPLAWARSEDRRRLILDAARQELKMDLEAYPNALPLYSTLESALEGVTVVQAIYFFLDPKSRETKEFEIILTTWSGARPGGDRIFEQIRSLNKLSPPKEGLPILLAAWELKSDGKPTDISTPLEDRRYVVVQRPVLPKGKYLFDRLQEVTNKNDFAEQVAALDSVPTEQREEINEWVDAAIINYVKIYLRTGLFIVDDQSPKLVRVDGDPGKSKAAVVGFNRGEELEPQDVLRRLEEGVYGGFGIKQIRASVLQALVDESANTKIAKGDAEHERIAALLRSFHTGARLAVSDAPQWRVSSDSKQGPRDFQDDRTGIERIETEGVRNGRGTLYFIADGFGGSNAVDEIKKSFTTLFRASLKAEVGDIDIHQLEALSIKEAFEESFYNLHRATESFDSGSTLVAAYISDDEARVTIASLGDSLAWVRASDGTLIKNEKHHTQNPIELEKAKKRGALLDAQGRVRASGSPGGVELTRFFGNTENKGIADRKPHIFEAELEPGSTIFLASDGIESIGEKGLEDMLASNDTDASKFVDLALQKGSQDNVTAMIVRREPLEENGARLAAIRLEGFVAQPVFSAEESDRRMSILKLLAEIYKERESHLSVDSSWKNEEKPFFTIDLPWGPVELGGHSVRRIEMHLPFYMPLGYDEEDMVYVSNEETLIIVWESAKLKEHQFESLLGYLKGDELDLHRLRLGRESTPLSDSDWFWVTQDPMSYQVYPENVDPLMLEVTREAVRRIEAESSRAEMIVADLFSGDGRFVQKMAEDLKEKSVRFVGVERRSDAVETAKKRVYERRAEFKQAEIPTDGSSLEKMIDRPDIITIVGGINDQVTTRENALRVVRAANEALKPGGYLLTTGRTESLLDAEDFKAAGFDVLNRSIPGNLLKGRVNVPQHLYVLQKNGARLTNVKPITPISFAKFYGARLTTDLSNISMVAPASFMSAAVAGGVPLGTPVSILMPGGIKRIVFERRSAAADGDDAGVVTVLKEERRVAALFDSALVRLLASKGASASLLEGVIEMDMDHMNDNDRQMLRWVMPSFRAQYPFIRFYFFGGESAMDATVSAGLVSDLKESDLAGKVRMRLTDAKTGSLTEKVGYISIAAAESDAAHPMMSLLHYAAYLMGVQSIKDADASSIEDHILGEVEKLSGNPLRRDVLGKLHILGFAKGDVDSAIVQIAIEYSIQPFMNVIVARLVQAMRSTETIGQAA